MPITVPGAPVVFPDVAGARAKGLNNAIREIQLRTLGNELKRQQVLEQTAQEAAAGGQYDPEQHATLLEQNGMFQQAFKLRQLVDEAKTRKADNTFKQVERYGKALDIVAKTVPLIRTQEQYDNFRAGLEQTGIIPAGILPQVYDDQARETLFKLGGNAQATYELLTGKQAQQLGFPQGTVLQRNRRTNALSVLLKPEKGKAQTRFRTLTMEEKRQIPGINPRDVVQVNEATGEIRVARKGEREKAGIDNAVSNNIGRQVAAFFGGIVNPVTGEITFDKTNAPLATKIRADAERIYVRGGGKITPAQAVAEAARQNGIEIGAGQPQATGGAPADPLGLR